MNMLVVTMYNSKQGFNTFVHQISRNEFKIKQQLGMNSFSTEFVYGLHELARTLFVLYINGFEVIQCLLGYEVLYAIHSGQFSELEENKRQIQPSDRRSSVMTAYIDEDEALCRTQSIEHMDEDLKDKDKNEIK